MSEFVSKITVSIRRTHLALFRLVVGVMALVIL